MVDNGGYRGGGGGFGGGGASGGYGEDGGGAPGGASGGAPSGGGGAPGGGAPGGGAPSGGGGHGGGSVGGGSGAGGGGPDGSGPGAGGGTAGGGIKSAIGAGAARVADQVKATLEIKDTGNAKVDAMGDIFNAKLALFTDAPPPEQGALGWVNKGIQVAMAVKDFTAIGQELMDTGFAMATAGIAAMMPALPAAFLTVPHLGTPHAHAHPPSLVPPAPPVPLPSIGQLMLAGSVGVLIMGMPAGRCGDLGLAVTCGSLAPAFDVFLGSSNTFIAGSRAARMGDMTRHCNPSSALLAVGRGAALFSAGVAAVGVAADAVGGGPVMGAIAQIAADLAAAAMSALLGKDPGIPPAFGALMMGAPTVLIGGFPCPNLPNPLDAMMHGLKCLTKAIGKSKGFGKLIGKVGLCNSPGEPINPFTGEVYNDFEDYQAPDTGFVWERHYQSGWNQEDGPLGFGFRHFYQRRLTFLRKRAIYETHDNEVVALQKLADGSYRPTSGFQLSTKDGRFFELLTDRDETLLFELQPTSPASARLIRYAAKNVDVYLFYEANGRLRALSESPPSGVIDTHFAYDASGHIEQVVRAPRGQPLLAISRYRYYDGCLVEWHDALGAIARMRYDDAHRMVQGTDRRGYSFHWAYDPKNGKCIASHGDDGLWGVEAKYEGSTATFTEPDGGVWTFKHYPDGGISHILDPHGGIKQYVRDDGGRVVKQIDPDGSEYEWLYEPNGKHVARLGPFRNVLLPEDQEPNPRGPLSHRGPKTQAEWLWGFEAARPRVGVDALPGVARSALALSLAALNEPGPVAARDLCGRTIQATHATGANELFQYDPQGNLTARQDTRGNWWQQRIESWDQVGGDRSPLGAVTEYRYTHRQKRASITDPNGTRTDYVYDKQQRVIAVLENGRTHVRYQRDAQGNVTEERDQDGVMLVSHEPNTLGLRTRSTFASGEQYTYAYDSLGNIAQASSSLHEVTQGHFRRHLTADLRDSLGVRHFYATDERVERTVLFERFVTDYEDRAGGVRITTPDGVEHDLWRSSDGALVRENGNGTCEAMVFDREHRLAGRVCWRGDTGVEHSTWAVRYAYDPEGLLQETLDSERGPTRYAYDPDQRLVTQQGPGATKLEYRYDNAGNLSYTPAHGPIERHPDNLLSHTHVERFECDSRKRIAKRIKHDGSEIAYAYDSADQLIGATFSGRSETWQAAYDGCGRRLWREYGGERTDFYWDGDRLAAEVGGDGALRLYVYANVDTLVPFMWLDYTSIAAAPESGVAHYLFCAPTGMPLRVEDAAGRVEWLADSPEAYGVLGGQGPAPVRLRFAGHFYDEHLDLFYNRFRDYDPKLGRYLQRDPLGHAGGANLYAYCANPVVDVDLLGLIHTKKKATKAEAETPGPTRPLAKGDIEELELPNGLRKVTTGDDDGGHTVRHFDENGNELSVHKFNEHGQLTRAELVVGPKSPDYDKQGKRHTPEDMGPNDQRGHAGPEVHAKDQRAANVPENVLAEHQASNQGPKKRFENGVPDAVDTHHPKEVRTVHNYEYPDNETKRPSSSSHGITADGEPLPEHNSGDIPNDASARNTTLASEQGKPPRKRR